LPDSKTDKPANNVEEEIMPKIIVYAIAFTLAPVVSILPSAAFADHFRVCMGENQANGCPVSHDAMFGCGVSIDDAANQLCAVTTNGQKTVAPYNYVHQGSHGGNRCGYEWYDLNCHF
jgi:hypothetical protein